MLPYGRPEEQLPLPLRFSIPLPCQGRNYGDGGLLAHNPVYEDVQDARHLWFPK